MRGRRTPGRQRQVISGNLRYRACDVAMKLLSRTDGDDTHPALREGGCPSVRKFFLHFLFVCLFSNRILAVFSEDERKYLR